MPERGPVQFLGVPATSPSPRNRNAPPRSAAARSGPGFKIDALQNQRNLVRFVITYPQHAESEALRTGFRRKPDSIPMIADSR